MKTTHITRFVVRFACLVILLNLIPGRASAWGTEGHQIVARIAAKHLTDKTKIAIAALLKADKEDFKNCRQFKNLENQLACVATWADQVRNMPKYRNTAGFHFVNIPVEGPPAARRYDAKYCEQGCVVSALATNRQTLLTSKVAAQRAVALKFIIHFIGDLHQPMHNAVDRDRDFNNPENSSNNHTKLPGTGASDRGANLKLVVWLNQPVTPFGCWKLHTVWDEGIIEEKNTNDSDYAARLNTGLDLPALRAGSVTDWVNEALDLAVTTGYGKLPVASKNDKVCEVKKGSVKQCRVYSPAVCRASQVHYRYKLDNSYYQASLPVVELQLQRAGVRLAQYLNSIFDPGGTMP